MPKNVPRTSPVTSQRCTLLNGSDRRVTKEQFCPDVGRNAQTGRQLFPFCLAKESHRRMDVGTQPNSLSHSSGRRDRPASETCVYIVYVVAVHLTFFVVSFVFVFTARVSVGCRRASGREQNVFQFGTDPAQIPKRRKAFGHRGSMASAHSYQPAGRSAATARWRAEGRPPRDRNRAGKELHHSVAFSHFGCSFHLGRERSRASGFRHQYLHVQ